MIGLASADRVTVASAESVPYLAVSCRLPAEGAFVVDPSCELALAVITHPQHRVVSSWTGREQTACLVLAVA